MSYLSDDIESRYQEYIQSLDYQSLKNAECIALWWQTRIESCWRSLLGYQYRDPRVI